MSLAGTVLALDNTFRSTVSFTRHIRGDWQSRVFDKLPGVSGGGPCSRLLCLDPKRETTRTQIPPLDRIVFPPDLFTVVEEHELISNNTRLSNTRYVPGSVWKVRTLILVGSLWRQRPVIETDCTWSSSYDFEWSPTGREINGYGLKAKTTTVRSDSRRRSRTKNRCNRFCWFRCADNL